MADWTETLYNLWCDRPRLTMRGSLVELTALFLCAAGVLRGESSLVQLGLFLALLLVLAFPLAWLNLRGLSVFHRHAPATYAGDDLDVEVTIENAKSWCGSYDLELMDSLIDDVGYALTRAGRTFAGASPLTAAVIPAAGRSRPAREDGGARLTARLRKRGLYGGFAWALASEFPLGLFRVTHRGRARSRLTVYPRPLRLSAALLASPTRLGAGARAETPLRAPGDTFRGLAEYATGDSLRHIHWPLSARYGEWVVKDFMPQGTGRAAVLFHACQPQGEYVAEDSERALRLLAGLFHHLHDDRGVAFEFAASFTGWRGIEVDEHAEAMQDVLQALAGARVKTSRNWDRLQQEVGRRAERAGVLLVVSNVPCRYWLHRLPPHPGLVCLDNSGRPQRPGGVSQGVAG